jgi:hypothetical protein
MAFPKIGYRDIITAASSVVVTSEASGFPITNISDRKAYTVWKATSTLIQNIDIDMGAAGTAADSICFAGGNAKAAGVNIAIWNHTASPARAGGTLKGTIVNVDWPATEVIMKEFTSGDLRYWSIVITAGTVPVFLGDVRLAPMLTLTEYLAASVDAQVEQVEASIERAEGGYALGAAMRRVIRQFNIDIGPAGAEWATAFTPANLLNDFWTNHARKYRTFFFHGNIADATVFQPMYLVVQDGARLDRQIIGGRYTRRGFVLPVESAIAETP